MRMRSLSLVLVPLVLTTAFTLGAGRAHAGDEVTWHKRLSAAKAVARPILVYVRDGT